MPFRKCPAETTILPQRRHVVGGESATSRVVRAEFGSIEQTRTYGYVVTDPGGAWLASFALFDDARRFLLENNPAHGATTGSTASSPHGAEQAA